MFASFHVISYIHSFVRSFFLSFVLFSRMRSKVSRFTLGVWGLRVCSLNVAFVFATVHNRPQPPATARNRPQLSATVRNRPQPSARSLYGRAYMVSSAKGVTFGGFSCGAASFCVADVALRDIQTCLVACRKSFCVAGAILLRRFRRAVLRVFCASHCQGCVEWRQGGANSVAGVAFCEM